MKLTNKQRSAAIQRYARKHGYFPRTVRHMTSLRFEAVAEYLDAKKFKRVS